MTKKKIQPVPHLQEYVEELMPALIQDFRHGLDRREIVQVMFSEPQHDHVSVAFQMAYQAWQEDGMGPAALEEVMGREQVESEYKSPPRVHIKDVWNLLPKHGSKLPWLVWELRKHLLNLGIESLSRGAVFFVSMELLHRVVPGMSKDDLKKQAARMAGTNPIEAKKLMAGSKKAKTEAASYKLEADFFLKSFTP